MTREANATVQGQPAAAFREAFVEADGFRVRYLEAGRGSPLVHLHGAGGPLLTPAHELLSRRFRVLVFEMPGFGGSSENTRTGSMQELAATMARAITAAGVGDFGLWGTSFGGKTALWLALQAPARVSALVLEAPAAVRPQGSRLPSGSPEEVRRRLFAHPERMPWLALPAPDAQARMSALVARLAGPDRDAELEGRLPGLQVATLALFGTLDSLTPPEMGRIYVELLPDCHLVFVYDAAHVISGDRPEAFVEVVSDFLERRGQFVVNYQSGILFP